MRQISAFENNPRLLYGSGCVAQLGGRLGKLGVQKALIVTDPGIVAAGLVDRVIAQVTKAGIAHVVFDEIEPNPSLETAELIARIYHEEGCSGMIAVGGGSPMDAAKGAGILLTNRGELRDFANGTQIAASLPPTVAIPTTVGTGSEVTKFAVLTDHDAAQKLMLTSERLVPALAILDPELVYALPAQIVAMTGIDALTHAIESVLSVFAKPTSDALALEAISLISRHLLTAVTVNGTSADGQLARSQLLYASTLAGMAFNDALLGLVHGMSHPLTSYYGVPHGLANALLLPPVMRFNAPVCASALGRVAQAMGKPSSAEAAIEAVGQLIGQLGLPTTLGAVGVTETFMAYLVADAFASANAQIINPRTPTEAEILGLYRQLL